MNDGRLVIATFCDDIRQERGNKYSLMGCYGDEIVLDKFPAVLPRFAARVLIMTPIDRHFEQLKVRAVLGGDVIAELDVPQSDLSNGQGEAAAKAIPEHRRLTINAMMGFAPLVVEESCRLVVEAECEEGTVRGSSVLFRLRTKEDPPL